jgi:hypothetical protein
MKSINKSTVVSVVVGMAVFGGLIYLANRTGVPAVVNAANAIK